MGKKRVSFGSGRPRTQGRVFSCRSFDATDAKTLANLRQRFGLGRAAAVELAIRLRCAPFDGRAEPDNAGKAFAPFTSVITVSAEADAMLRQAAEMQSEARGERVSMSDLVGDGLSDLEYALENVRYRLRPLRPARVRK